MNRNPGWLPSAVLAVFGGWNKGASLHGRDGTTMCEVAAHLARARDLLLRQEAWSQDAYACDANGAVVGSHEARAVRFCCAGALYATEDPAVGSVDSRAAFSRAICQDIEVWNDTPGRHQSEVIAAFDRAIALASRETT